MTLEYLELMEEVKNSQLRKKCVKSFKSNTRVFDDNSIEVTPQEKGQPAQTDVRKVGRSKRYATTGKNPLTCIELKCPDDVADKAAFFHKELAKLTKDMEIEEPKMPEGVFLLNEPCVKVKFAADEQRVMAWLTFEVEGLLDVRTQLYQLSSKIDKCFVINEALVRQPK